jgi:hypothetical protein
MRHPHNITGSDIFSGHRHSPGYGATRLFPNTRPRRFFWPAVIVTVIGAAVAVGAAVAMHAF